MCEPKKRSIPYNAFHPIILTPVLCPHNPSSPLFPCAVALAYASRSPSVVGLIFVV